jgi:signal transduction histidine kinase/DNA-binding response OmpR family regulator
MKRTPSNASPVKADSRSRSERSVSLPQLDAIRTLADATFNVVFDSSCEALLVVDSAGILQKANPRARELLRLKSTSPSRRGLKDFLRGPTAEQFTSLCAPDVFAGAPQCLDGFLAAGFPIRVALRSILPGTQHLLVCLEEDSLVERAESKWRRVDAELRGILDSVRGGVILFDPLGQIRFSTARFAELFGLDVKKLEEIANFDQLTDLLAGRFRAPEAFTAPWKLFAAGRGQPCHDELEIVRPIPRVFERFSRPVVDLGGSSVGWLEIYSDVTEQRQIHAKMLQTEKMAALGQVVSGIAHELNNPLTTIMGYAQLLLGRGLIPAYLPEARKVYHEADRARRIVKNLLYFARENKPERTPVDLNEIIERTVALRSYELRVEDISVEYDLSPDLPKTMADPYQLQQVVLNLVVNAEQALLEERGQGIIRVRTHHLAGEFGNRIHLEISDNGPGIPHEIASRIFDPFFTTKAPGVGTGLGLSIVYGIVRQHEGEVMLDSQNGAGTRFLVELPIVPVPLETQPKRSSDAIGPRSEVGSKRILVVEDEPTIAQLIEDILTEDGHRVESVLNSQEGLTRISRDAYDLVICDLRMPRLDGRAFYQALVRDASPLQKRIIFVTGDILAPRTLEFLELNRLPYLAKPFLVEELKLVVNQHVRRRANGSEPKPRRRTKKRTSSPTIGLSAIVGRKNASRDERHPESETEANNEKGAELGEPQE